MVTVPPVKPDWHDKAILVVEDEAHNFAYIREILKRTQATIVWVENGIEAIQEVSSRSFDLILMDIKLPEMDGFKATAEIKKMKPFLPIIAQTAYAMEKEMIACFEAGCDDYLAKPFAPERLLNTIQRHLTSRVSSQ